MTDGSPAPRAPGDHGTAQDAIDFLLQDGLDIGPGEETVFLKAWNEGDLDEWPEFYPWLAAREAARGRSDFSSDQLKAAALSAMRELADQEPEGWDRDLQLRAIAAAEAGEMDDQWPKSERAIRVFLKALSGAAQ